jgi:hypothetical protein
MCHGISPGHLQRKNAASSCDPPFSEKQAGIGPISQTPELLTMARSYDDAMVSRKLPPAWSGATNFFLAAFLYFSKRHFFLSNEIAGYFPAREATA